MRSFDQHKLKLGLFGLNCSGGLSATLVEERWEGTWAQNLEIAKIADDAGLDFLLPLGRWKGYGGQTDHNGGSLETLTWAAGIAARIIKNAVRRAGRKLAMSSSRAAAQPNSLYISV